MFWSVEGRISVFSVRMSLFLLQLRCCRANCIFHFRPQFYLQIAYGRVVFTSAGGVCRSVGGVTFVVFLLFVSVYETRSGGVLFRGCGMDGKLSRGAIVHDLRSDGKIV